MIFRTISRSAAATAIAALMLAGCGHKVSTNPTSLACADPLQGKKFGVCGHLTSAPTVDQGNVWVLNGAVDARTAAVAGQHTQIEEGTFHASH